MNKATLLGLALTLTACTTPAAPPAPKVAEAKPQPSVCSFGFDKEKSQYQITALASCEDLQKQWSTSVQTGAYACWRAMHCELAEVPEAPAEGSGEGE